MSIVDRYLMKVTLQGCGVILMALAALTLFVNFMGQSDDVGKGAYGIWDAFVFACLTLPSQLYQQMPIVALLGAPIGLGGLAANSELHVIRLSGASVLRMARSVLITGSVLMLLTGAFGEFIAPPLDQAARQFRTLKKYQKISIAGSNTGAWIKEGNDIISIDQMMSEGQVGGLYIYRFDDQRRLISVIRADGALTNDQGNWFLENMRESRLTDHGISASTAALSASPGLLQPDLLELSAIDTDHLSARGLYEYYHYLQKNDLESNHYEKAFWTRIATTASVPLMLLLALPFVLGPMKRSGIGARLVAGLVIGMIYRLGTRSLYYSGDVFDLDPLMVGWAPVVLLALMVSVGFSRVH
ncbi:MAG: LPS export ABC transporter permease LptG [Gammaproteobacteria bacterium]|nr:LPS export ABC transporter permease LptG [Gammaproteobacteria bacterium]